MKYHDYVTNNLWDYLKHVFNWDKYCCVICKENAAVKITVHQASVCERCWNDMSKKKDRGSGALRRIRELVEQKKKKRDEE